MVKSKGMNPVLDGKKIQQNRRVQLSNHCSSFRTMGQINNFMNTHLLALRNMNYLIPC